MKTYYVDFDLKKNINNELDAVMYRVSQKSYCRFYFINALLTNYGTI